MKMESMPYYFDSINRNAIVVKAKQPFLDWLNKVDSKYPITQLDEGTIYLIREKDSNKAIENWLKRNFDQIFQNELNDWFTDQTTWPTQRTFKLFKEWFEYEMCSMILDLEDTDVTKDC